MAVTSQSGFAAQACLGSSAAAIKSTEGQKGLTEISYLLLTMVFAPRIINNNLRLDLFKLERHLGVHLCFCLRL